MSEKKGKKRPKSYYIKCAHGGKKPKHANDLDVGMRGFLVTCNKYEKETVREMYNILNEYADKLYGPEKQEKGEESDHNSEDDDMEKAMMKETAEIKETKPNVRRFQNTDTKTKNLIFIRTTLEDTSELAHSIFTDVSESQVQKARYALRVLPVAVTCKANTNQISEKARELFKKYFETPFGVGLKFTSICKIRNNNSVSRTAILPSLSRVIQEMNPLHTLCHDEPDLVVMVEVIRNICCLSVIKDYFKFKKYNLHEILKTGTESESGNPGKNDQSPVVDSQNVGNKEVVKETDLDEETKNDNATIRDENLPNVEVKAQVENSKHSDKPLAGDCNNENKEVNDSLDLDIKTVKCNETNQAENSEILRTDVDLDSSAQKEEQKEEPVTEKSHITANAEIEEKEEKELGTNLLNGTNKIENY